MKSPFTFLILAAALSLSAGCAIGPDYKAPPPAGLGVPATWHATLPHTGSVAEMAKWWTQFNDPALTRLIEVAELNNPSLATAVGRIRSARASVTASRGGFLPTLSGSGSYVRSKNATDPYLLYIAPAGSISSYTYTNTKTASGDASWEIDLFGGNRRSLEGSTARLASAEASWHDARITLAADVATTYSTARAYQRLITIYERELASHQSTENLTALMIREGLVPSANALATEAATANSASVLENQKGLYAQLLNSLVLLTGLSYPEVEQILAPNAAIPQITTPAEIALPASIVTQRPDVRAAERQLAAACADIGVAEANMLPSLSLIGSIGINVTPVEGLTVTSRTWSFGPTVSVPFFQGGRLIARLESARAAYDQALATYRSTVQGAVQDVENSLVRVDTAARRRGFAEKAAQNFHAYFDSISQSYSLGKSSLLELEDARRQDFGSQEALLMVDLERAQAWIALYKSAGGGWASLTESVH